MVDLGCVSGPNTLLVISHIMDTLQDLCSRFQEIQVFLNDLNPEIMTSTICSNWCKTSTKTKKLKQNRNVLYMARSPGSFYDRRPVSKQEYALFAYSSYSVHWLSGCGMESKNILHMNTGDGETSYANNSTLQKYAITETWPILDETLKNMLDNERFAECCFKMVDFGCGSGPNTLLVVSRIMDTLQDFYSRFQEIQVFLNDLPDNDFNNLFKLVQNFYQEKETQTKPQCFIFGSPGSFYDRRFPSKCIHFAYSSYGVHWLSGVPKGLESSNKENIYIAMTSHENVLEAYANQFQRDFSKFLSARGEEIVCGWRMVLSLAGRRIEDTSSIDENAQYTILADTLHDMVVEGLIKNDDLYSFNVPIYTPCPREVETIICNEGSFKLDRMDAYAVPWDPSRDVDGFFFEKNRSAKFVADGVRAVIEPMLASHFSRVINYDVVFEKYAEKLAEHLSKEKPSYFTIAISLRRK